MNFREELEKKTAWTEEVVKSFLPREEGYQRTVMEAMNYSVLAGGKRLRPLLMYEMRCTGCSAGTVRWLNRSWRRWR